MCGGWGTAEAVDAERFWEGFDVVKGGEVVCEREGARVVKQGRCGDRGLVVKSVDWGRCSVGNGTCFLKGRVEASG